MEDRTIADSIILAAFVGDCLFRLYMIVYGVPYQVVATQEVIQDIQANHPQVEIQQIEECSKDEKDTTSEIIRSSSDLQNWLYQRRPGVRSAPDLTMERGRPTPYTHPDGTTYYPQTVQGLPHPGYYTNISQGATSYPIGLPVQQMEQLSVQTQWEHPPPMYHETHTRYPVAGPSTQVTSTHPILPWTDFSSRSSKTSEREIEPGTSESPSPTLELKSKWDRKQTERHKGRSHTPGRPYRRRSVYRVPPNTSDQKPCNNYSQIGYCYQGVFCVHHHDFNKPITGPGFRTIMDGVSGGIFKNYEYLVAMTEKNEKHYNTLKKEIGTLSNHVKKLTEELKKLGVPTKNINQPYDRTRSHSQSNLKQRANQ